MYFILFVEVGRRIAENKGFNPLKQLPPKHEWKGPSELEPLVESMMKQNPGDRPRMPQVLETVAGVVKPKTGIKEPKSFHNIVNLKIFK